ncbi:hypothetical protein GSI_09041 [Ganoderma sinense ZZ0214-1]|uniref:Ubiquitin-related modifier 1 n=1 Tax=Ganoderma sinense ZZ0214-1 TaxID=1077348 RepID=A0A2G8S5I2_9APHY|nr:hypothetical protein GSI_09041 [Ganoderma sinense ZZ0214-1]
MSTISLKIEFGGGLELLFSNQRSHRIDLPTLVPSPASASSATLSWSADGSEPPKKPADVTYLLFWLRDNLLKEREELFIENGTVSVDFASGFDCGETEAETKLG